MGRRLFSREFKLEAARLVRERGVSVVQASRDLGVGENVLRRWVKELSADPTQAFPGQGQMKPEHGLPPEKWSSLRYGFWPFGGRSDAEKGAWC